MTEISKYLKWLNMSDRLKALKKEEAALRRELCSDLFNGKQGNFKEVYNDKGVHVVATSKLTNNLDERVLQSLMGGLSDVEKACIKWKPSLVAAHYKVLPEDSILHEAVTAKPAMPTLSVTIDE